MGGPVKERNSFLNCLKRMHGIETSSEGVQSSKLEELQDVESLRIEAAKSLVLEMVGINDANALYLRCFQLLKLGGLEAEIPRLVVFGQQSMGKTTLLDFIMGGPIGYSSTDTGTKQPVVIMLKPTHKEHSRIECRLRNKLMDIKDLQDAMKQIMMSTETVLAEELELEIVVPGGVHAVFVDLPGIKDDSKEGAELTRSVVRSYVRNNPNDLYLLVKKASDDPANWPWSLREFILSQPPRGLGLTPRQTIVVGTRAKDFLTNEKNDIRNHAELLERVKKRAVKDSSGEALPLYLLELFSLSIEEKEQLDFPAKKTAMQQQIMINRAECMDLLSHSFESSSSAIGKELFKFFDVDMFKQDLNAKFQGLLNDQLSSLERRLVRKRISIQRQLAALEDQLAEKNPQSTREYIKLFLRELLTIITELVTGNYMIIRLPDSGDAFLNTYGGNLSENLEQGHQLSLELFPQKQLYDPEFLGKIRAHAESMLQRALQEREAMRLAAFPIDPNALQRVNEKPQPDLHGRLQPGQYVRFLVTRDSTQMLGHVHSMKQEASGVSSVSISFYFISGDTSSEQTQQKQLDETRVTVLTPLSMVISPSALPPPNFRCWLRTIRGDNWVGLVPISVRHVQLDPVVQLPPPPPGPDGTIPQQQQPTVTGTITYIPVDVSTDGLNNSSLDERYLAAAKLDQIFCDANNLSVGTLNVFEDISWTNMTAMQRIAGDFAETKLLNQLSLTHLGRWLKFHICSLEPDRRFSNHVLLQLMRSVKHIIDKADWEPLVADLLQANVRGGLLHLARLASCATAVALRRILKAAIHEVVRLIKSGDLTSGLLFLANNSRFIEEVDQALESYCRERALVCAAAMRDLIFEQTHAIHFEMIEDFFNGCRQFERDFLNSSLMDEVTRRVKEVLASRKQKLGGTDIYARHSGGMSHEMIYDEVRIQFWVAKQLLSAPLTTKLYMHFVKDIKDKSQHLASESKFGSSESDLERHLQEVLLCEQSSNINGRSLPRADGELLEHFGLSICQDELIERIKALKRTEEYIKWALEGVSRLRTQFQKQGGVDFLTRLNLTSGSPSPKTVLRSAKPTPKAAEKQQQELLSSNGMKSIDGSSKTIPSSEQLQQRRINSLNPWLQQQQQQRQLQQKETRSSLLSGEVLSHSKLIGDLSSFDHKRQSDSVVDNEMEDRSPLGNNFLVNATQEKQKSTTNGHESPINTLSKAGSDYDHLVSPQRHQSTVAKAST